MADDAGSIPIELEGDEGKPIPVELEGDENRPMIMDMVGLNPNNGDYGGGGQPGDADYSGGSDTSPPPVYGTGLSQPAVYDQLAQARSAGYGWDEVDGHIAHSRQDAADAGYSDPEVDNFLGYDTSDAALNRFTTGWRHAFAADPTLTANIADQPAPNAPSPVSLAHPDMMADYSRALLAGEVKGPQDFAEKYGQAYIAAYDSQNPERGAIQQQQLSDTIQGNVARASAALAAQLPDIKELTDTSLGLASAAAGDPSAAMVGDVRQNLMDRWADTGERPMQLYQRALGDPILGPQLTSPSVTPTGGGAVVDAIGRIYRAGVAGEKINWQGTGQDISDIARAPLDMAAHGPIPAALGVIGTAMAGGAEAIGKAGGAVLLPIIAGAHQLISETFARQANTPEESASLAQHFMNDVLPALGIPELGDMEAARAGARVAVATVRLVDPLKPITEATRTAPVTELTPRAIELPAEEKAPVAPGEPTPEPQTLGARLTAAEASPAEALQTIAREQGDSLPADTTVARMAADAGADPVTYALAEGYDAANVIYDHFHNEMVSQSGSLRSIFSTAQDAMDRAENNAARDYTQALIRQKRGLGDQFIAAQFAKLEQYRSTLQPHMADYERQIRQGGATLADNPLHQMLQYVEGRSTGAYMDPNSALKPVADALRDVYQNMRGQIEATVPDMTSFYEDYYRHLWERPGQADRAFGAGGKQGSGSSLNLRSIPTLAEGIEKGLVPRYLNPIDNTLNYVQGMAQHLAARQILDAARDRGFVKYHFPGQQPPGMTELTGLASIKAAPIVKEGETVGAAPMRAYASDGFARSYNNWLSKGAYSDPRLGKLYDRVLYATNAMTGIKLLMPTYHALAMASETSIASIANGLGELAHGDLLRGLKDVGAGITVIPSVAETMARGRRLQGQYLKMAGDPVAQLFAEAGGRAVGRQAIYKMGSTPSLFTSLSRGSLAYEVGQDLAHIVGTAEEAPARRAALFGPRIVGFAGKEFGRVMNTITAPLFDHAIPWLKMGAFGAEMDAWLRQNPTAPAEAARRQARILSDSMDNRFGELNQNNLFWPAYAKQLANLFLISTGWEYGSLRAFGNAAGWDVDRMQAAWNPTAFRWALGFMAGASLQNSLYQYVRTGSLPWQTNSLLSDLMAPRTGGQTPEHKPEHKPERAILPGYQKDVFNLVKAFLTAPDPLGGLQNMTGIIGHKFSPLWQSAWTALVTGQDAIGHHIADMPINGKKPNGFLDRMHNYMAHVFGPALEPIAMQNQGQHLKGTGLSPIESTLGIRPAPAWMVDPERFAHGQAIGEANRQNDEMRRSFYENRRSAAPNPDAPTAAQLKRETPLTLQRDPHTGKVVHAAGPAKRDPWSGAPVKENAEGEPVERDRWSGQPTRNVKRDFYGMPVRPRRHPAQDE
ncbi:MAG TPA: hypothetical protein VHW66_21900 [Stellaceae bacterium]|nr:hypothetical protein [Stellaceae bacterium]